MNLGRLLAAGLAGLSLLAMGGGVTHAANIPMYDGDTSRSRLIPDPSLSPTQLYLSVPTYLSLPGQSFSTPTYYQGILYQYTYSGNTGTLYALNLPNINGDSVLRSYNYALPGYLTRSVQYAESPLHFTTSDGAYGVQAQDSVTTAQGWQAIAVGRRLYAWQLGKWPAQQQAINNVQIPATPGNTHNQVDMSPLITPPIPVKVVNAQRKKVSVTVPVAVACSWDGGCATMPLGLTSMETPAVPIKYVATQENGGFPGDTQAAITSDPVYIPHDSMFPTASDPQGDPAVAFGVASWSHPRIEVLDLVTGAAKAIGASGSVRIGAAIADAGMLATLSNGHQYLVYHDEYGNVYSFNLDGSASERVPSGSTTMELAEDGSQTSAQYPGSAGAVVQPVLGPGELLFAPVSKVNTPTFGYESYVNPSSPSSVYGSSSLPSALCDEASTPDDCRYVTAWSFSASRSWNGKLVSGPGIELSTQFGDGTQQTSPGQYPYGNSGQFIVASVSPYVGPVLDVGSEHYVMSWTNSDPNGSGAIVMYAPVNYGVAASGPSSASGGQTVTIKAKPFPSGVTHDRLQGPNGDLCQVGSSPVTLRLTSSLGSSGAITMQRTTAPSVGSPWSVWSGDFNLPANSTGASVKWTGTVTAVDKYCTRESTTVAITEPSLTGTGLSPTQGGGGNGGGAVTGSGTLQLDPNPALYGQKVSVTLTPTDPPAPTVASGDKLTTWSWKINASPALTWPLKPANWAFGFPVVATQTQTESMSVSGNGHSATASFVEDWWNGGCHTPTGACNWITDESAALQGEQGVYIPARTWPVTASYKTTLKYTYEIPITTWVTNPACKTKNPPDTCNAEGQTPQKGWQQAQGTQTAADTASAQFDTDGTTVRSVGGG